VKLEARDFPILVTDAQTTAALACLRSLSQAGYPVHILGEEGPSPLAFASRHARLKAVGPRYDDPRFGPWIEAYLREHGIRLVLPTERFLHSLGPRLASVLPLLHARVSEESLRRSLSKYDLFESFHAAGDPRLLENLPPHLLVRLSEEPPSAAALTALGSPLFLKIDRGHRLDQGSSEVLKVEDARAALALLKQLRGRVSKVLVQGFVRGRGVGAFLLRWQGRVHADFCHVRLHEVPYTGGYSSLRAPHFDPRLIEDSERRAAALGWEGPAMFEYRQDADSKDFRLMELNPRFWGSLHLALYAGVDFPRILAELARGERPAPLRGPRGGPTARLLVPAEFQHLLSRLKARELSLFSKAASVVVFFALFLHPRVRDDLFYPGDRKLYWNVLRNYMGQAAVGISNKIRRRLRR
jgi:predicted ATP-grasp superfamily ATP-dependent carboligase